MPYPVAQIAIHLRAAGRVRAQHELRSEECSLLCCAVWCVMCCAVRIVVRCDGGGVVVFCGVIQLVSFLGELC